MSVFLRSIVFIPWAAMACSCQEKAYDLLRLGGGIPEPAAQSWGGC